MANTTELREQRVKMIADARKLLDKAEEENRDLSAEENEQFEKIHADAETIRARYERIEKQEEQEKHAEQMSERGRELRERLGGGSAVPPANDGADTVPTGSDHAYALQGWMRATAASPMDLTPQHQAAMQKCGIRENAKEISFKLAHTHAFRQARDSYFYYRNAAIPRPQMVQTTTTPSGGGALIPDGFIQNLEMAMLAFGGMMQVSEILRTDSGEPLDWPTVDDTSNSGELIGSETTDVTNQDASFGAKTFNAYRYSSKMIKVSVTLLQDSAFDLASIIGNLAGERLGRIANTHLTTGDGAAKPNGIVTAATVGKTAAATSTFTTDELKDLIHAVDPSYRPGSQFMMHDNSLLVLKKLKDGNGRYLMQPDVTMGAPDRFDGYAISINQDMASSLAASGKPILFGQLPKYKVRMVREIRMRRLVERYAETDQEAFVAFARWDGNLLDAGTNPVQVLQMAAA